jgi:hypothetical protein
MSTRRRSFTVRNAWRDRVTPAFVRYWSAMKANHAILKIRDRGEQARAFRHSYEELKKASHDLHREQQKITDGISARIWRAISAPLDGEGEFRGDETGKIYFTSPESNDLFRELVFLRHGITFRELIVKLEVEKNPIAYRQLSQVHYDYYRFLANELRMEDLKLKFNFNHFHLMVEGFDHGIPRLNEWELASCFDEICPCGQRHSVEYMKKFRMRARRACNRLLTHANDPTTISLPAR